MWRWAAVSVRGSGHERVGLPCQDASSAQVMETERGPVLLAVAADGAGSAPFADVGARRVCEGFLTWMGRRLAEGADAFDALLDSARTAWTADLLTELRQGIAEEAERSNEPLSAYAATLLGCAIGMAGAVFVQVGDGAVVFRDAPDGTWALACPPWRGEYANTTVFVTSNRAHEALSLRAVPGCLREVVLMTDGVEFLAIRQADAKPHLPFFDFITGPFRVAEAAWSEQEAREFLERFLASEAVCTRTDDDKTLIVAIRQEGDGLPHRTG